MPSRQIQKYDWAKPGLGLGLEIRLLLGIVLGVPLTRLAAVLAGSQLTLVKSERENFVKSKFTK